MCSDRDCQDSQGCTIGKWDFQWVLVGLNLLLAIALGHPTLRGLEVVDTGHASYQGIQTYGDVISYLGIPLPPYAEPPLGDLCPGHRGLP